MGHVASGITSLPLFMNTTARFARYDSAVDHAAELNAIPATNVTLSLSYHDYMRFEVAEGCFGGYQDFFVLICQGTVLFFCSLVATQVLLRVSCITMADVIQFRVTLAEFGSACCTVMTFLTVLGFGSASGDRVEFHYYVGFVCAMAFLALSQFLCLHVVCRDILAEHHHLLSSRVSPLRQGPVASSEQTLGSLGQQNNMQPRSRSRKVRPVAQTEASNGSSLTEASSFRAIQGPQLAQIDGSPVPPLCCKNHGVKKKVDLLEGCSTNALLLAN